MNNDQNNNNSTEKNKILPPEEKNNKKINGEVKQDKKDKVKILPNKKSKYLTIVDDTTGEVEAYIKLQPKTLGTGWVALYQDAVSMIADWNLPNEQYRVFLKLLGNLDFDNYLRISQKQFAKELGIKQPHVSRAIKALEQREIIVEGPRAGLNKTYRLNPYVAHKGKDVKNTTIDFASAAKKKSKRKKVETEEYEE